MIVSPQEYNGLLHQLRDPNEFSDFLRIPANEHIYTINLDDRKIYFSFGGHVGYYLPDGVENYYLELDAPRTLYSQKLDGPYLNGDREKDVENGTKIPLDSNTYRAYDLIFKDIDFSAISLFHNSGK